MKKFISFFLSAMILISISVPAFAADELFTNFLIKIVHTNDIHARVEENAKSGIIGVTKLKSIIDEFTSGADMDLVLDSGDLFHGQSIATLVQGESIARLVKACGYDAMTAGNHDWSYGKDRLKELTKMSGLEMLTGNVVDENGNQFFDHPYYIESAVKDGKTVTVGIFGVIDPSIYSSTAPSNVEGLIFTDPVAYANSAANELKSEGCDIVIALTHTYNPADLASEVNGVDLWLAGHEHIDIDTTVTTPDGSTTYVIEDGYYLYEAGLIELNCTLDAYGNVAEIECIREAYDYAKASVYEDDFEVSAVLAEINSEQSVILEQIVGKSPVDLDGDWYDLRIDETNLGRAVTDAYLLETGADIAFENAGGIRASVAAGDVTYSDIIGISPYGNYIVTKQITGEELLEVLETSIQIQSECIAAYESGDVSAWPASSGSYLQTGGITVEYNLDLDYGSRVISVKVGEEPLDKNKLYTIATNNFVAVSAYYSQINDSEETGEYSACDEALIKYFKQDESVILQSVTNERMIKTDKTSSNYDTDSENNTETETTESVTDKPSEIIASEPSEITTEAVTEVTNPSKGVQTNIATDDTAINNIVDNGAVQTGSESTAVLLLIVISATTLCLFCIRKRS